MSFEVPDPSLPPFRSRGPWWGADLQTVRNACVGPTQGSTPPHQPGRRVVLPLRDGSSDRLAGWLAEPAEPSSQPLVVLIHGLGGSEESAYLRASASHWLGAGFPVLRLNLRGAGPSRPMCKLQYHAGRSGDLADALRSLEELEPDLTSRGFVLMAFSLGANMLLKFLAIDAEGLPVRAAASVSAPIDLEAASRRFLEPRNLLYHWHLLRWMKREALAPGAGLEDGERAAVKSARSIWDFDEHFVAPRNGYRGALDYYADNAAIRFLTEIRTPTLVMHARNDPWIPPAAYTDYPWNRNPSLRLLLAKGGGHVGFHARGSAIPWHDRCAEIFFRSTLASFS